MKWRIKQSGFTMIELLIVMTIGAILMAIAIPSYKYVTTANRVAGEINGLLGDVQYARYEAIKEGLNVTICPAASATSITCDLETTWSGGWIVLSNAGLVMRRQLAFSTFNSNDTMSTSAGVKSLIFNREGFVTGLAIGGVTFSLHDPTSTAQFTRCLIVNTAGATATTTSGNTMFGATCS